MNNNKHNIIKVHFSTEEIALEVSNYDLFKKTDVVERFIDPDDKTKGMKQDYFGAPVSVTVGKIENIDTNVQNLPGQFSGCMSGAKMVMRPFANMRQKVRKSMELDLFDAWVTRPKGATNPSGTAPGKLNGYCGMELPTPGVMPTVGPVRQFFTRSPGLDNSVKVSTIDTANHIIILVVIIIIAVVLLGFLFLIYKYVNKSHVTYRKLKKEQVPAGPATVPQTQYNPPQTQYNPPPPMAAAAPQSYYNPPSNPSPAPVRVEYKAPAPTTTTQAKGEGNWYL